MSNTGQKMQDRASELLAKCLEITKQRREQYGGDVFEAAANIANAITPGTMCRYTARDVHLIMLTMKLARYGFQRSLQKDNQCEHTLVDSAIDAAVYMALMEAAREIKNEQNTAGKSDQAA